MASKHPISLELARENAELKNLLADAYHGLEMVEQTVSFLLGYLEDSGLITDEMRTRRFAGFNPDDPI